MEEEGVSGNLSPVPATEGAKPEIATLVQSESVPPLAPVLLSEGPSLLEWRKGIWFVICPLLRKGIKGYGSRSS